MIEQGKKNLKHLEDIGMKLEKIKYPYYYVYSRGIIYNDEIDERRIVNVETMESTKTTVDFVKMNNCREDIKIIYAHYINTYFICVDNCIVYYCTGKHEIAYHGNNKYTIEKITGISRINDNTIILRVIIVTNKGYTISDEYITDIIVSYTKDEPDVTILGNSSVLLFSTIISRVSKVQSIIISNKTLGINYAIKENTDTSVIYRYIQNCSANGFFVNEPTSSTLINSLDVNGKIQIEKDNSYYEY